MWVVNLNCLYLPNYPPSPTQPIMTGSFSSPRCSSHRSKPLKSFSPRPPPPWSNRMPGKTPWPVPTRDFCWRTWLMGIPPWVVVVLDVLRFLLRHPPKKKGQHAPEKKKGGFCQKMGRMRICLCKETDLLRDFVSIRNAFIINGYFKLVTYISQQHMSWQLGVTLSKNKTLIRPSATPLTLMRWRSKCATSNKATSETSSGIPSRQHKQVRGSMVVRKDQEVAQKRYFKKLAWSYPLFLRPDLLLLCSCVSQYSILAFFAAFYCCWCNGAMVLVVRCLASSTSTFCRFKGLDESGS